MGFCRNTLLTIFGRLASKRMRSAWAAGPASEGQVRLGLVTTEPILEIFTNPSCLACSALAGSHSQSIKQALLTSRPAKAPPSSLSATLGIAAFSFPSHQAGVQNSRAGFLLDPKGVAMTVNPLRHPDSVNGAGLHHKFL
jgi:hypothetical protein